MRATLRRPGVHVSRKRVERLMREAGLAGVFLRKTWRTSSTRQNPAATPAPDLVNRDFTAPAPNRLWVADATRIPCAQGVFWLAAVRDAFSNRIVGWRCPDRCDTGLILGALEYAVWSRGIRDRQVVHHSDGVRMTRRRASVNASMNMAFSRRWARSGMVIEPGQYPAGEDRLVAPRW